MRFQPPLKCQRAVPGLDRAAELSLFVVCSLLVGLLTGCAEFLPMRTKANQKGGNLS
jgi:hypothetical protein